MWEKQRLRSATYISDIYDTPRWQEKIGRATPLLSRIVVQMCVDSFPAYGRKELHSLKPVQYLILSLPPWLRYKTEFMLVQMLIRADLKGQAAKKYYDWAADEMNDLSFDGVDGVKLLIFGDTLDSPGRRELLNMQAVTAFYPCPHCLHTWQPGLGKQIYGGYRCFMEMNSPWRKKEFVYQGQHYQFVEEETRRPPIIRTDAKVRTMVTIATLEERPFCGHKGPRFLDRWEQVDWDGSTPDVMHDQKVALDMFVRTLVGHRFGYQWHKDKSHRRFCKTFGIFKEFAYGGPAPWPLTKDQVCLLLFVLLLHWCFLTPPARAICF